MQLTGSFGEVGERCETQEFGRRVDVLSCFLNNCNQILNGAEIPHLNNNMVFCAGKLNLGFKRPVSLVKLKGLPCLLGAEFVRL